ncbi:MAG: dynamin family protein [Marvinbryantia sp.]|jgi:hypothetical protein
MGKTYLQMKYHPAKKEVVFRRFENGKEQIIQGSSRLRRYMDQKGSFVLQDHGNKFLRDIARAFDSEKNLNIQVITTKADYEDFEQMVEYYNADLQTQCKITTDLIAELPDMNQTFKEVTKFGEKAVKILETYRRKLSDTSNISQESVKRSAENFAEQINKEARNIREKIVSMNDNKVNVCFTGVYSAGKSALINAILGYKILPEKITSKTAKMFQISSPMKGENVKIIFGIDHVRSILEWNEEKNALEFKEGPRENDKRADIQSLLNKLTDDNKLRHEQISDVLTSLNDMDAVSNDIKIIFPIPLDTRAVQFTIYDTPGTDSNYIEHQKVLMNALSEQTQSILVFVAAPTKLEGTGNNALLKYLKEAESKDSKTSIDLARSLFVINWADTIDLNKRIDLQDQEIKYSRNGEGSESIPDFSIKLSDKKLFFTSALYAYEAKAKKNGIISDSMEESDFQFGMILMQNENRGYVYRQNRCATSEFATEKMHLQCEEALKDAKEEHDDAKVLEICSGLYALEREIQQYGEKYASSVKAYAITDCVNKALLRLINRVNTLEVSNQEDIGKIQNNIIELRETLNSAIKEEYEKKAIPINAVLPEKILKQLTLDQDTVHDTILDNVTEYMDKELKPKFFRLGKVVFNKSESDKITEECDRAINSYSIEFLEKRQIVLESERDDFLQKIKDRIMENSRISDEAKKFILDIPTPEVPVPENVQGVGNAYEANKYTKGKWIFKREYLKKPEFMKDVDGILLGIIQKLREDYIKDYKKSLETVLMQIAMNFTTNLESYSLDMGALIENRDAMQDLRQKVLKIAEILEGCEKEFNDIIWREA